MDDVLYQTIFFTHKLRVIDVIRCIRDLEASCDLLIKSDEKYLPQQINRLKDSLLDYKSAKFDLISRAYFEDTPNPYDDAHDPY